MRTNIIKKIIKPEYTLFGILALMILVFSLSSPVFITPGNLLEALRQCSINAVMILGLTWIISSGEIDASFPDVAAYSSMIIVILVNRGIGWGPAVLIAILTSIVFGLLNGFLVSVLRFPSLIATIGVASIAKSIAAILGKGQVISLQNSTGNFLYPIVWGKIIGIPVLLLVAITIYAAFSVIQNRTRFGQYIFALGENRIATKEAGINEKRIIIGLFIISSIFAAIGGALMATVLKSGQPKLGISLFLDGFTAVFLGAMLFKLGKTNIMGTLFGAVILSLLGNGLTLLGAPFYFGQIIKGVLLIVGVAIVAITNMSYQKRGEEIVQGACE